MASEHKVSRAQNCIGLRKADWTEEELLRTFKMLKYSSNL